MNRYRKIFHHITAEDVAKDNLRLLNAKKLEEKKIEEEEKYLAAVAEKLHCDWRVELDKEEAIQEGMTTTSLFAVSFGASDADLLGWNHTDENGDTIQDTTDFFRDIDAGVVDDTGSSYPGLDGNAFFIPDGLGGGTGNNGGFNIHGTKESYMWMAGVQGTESSGGFFRTSPLDGRFADTISVTAIVGNGSNGGIAPHPDGWGLYVYHWHPGKADGWTLLGDPNNASDWTLVPTNGAGELTTYTLNLPESARVKDLHFNFGWYNSSATVYAGDIGITQIGIRRNAPKNVVMSLDDPQASAFIRTGEQHFASKGKKISGSKKERYEKVVDMLKASQLYTQKILGMQFPGSKTVLFGDEVKETDLEKYQAKERARYSAQVEREFQNDPNQHGSKAWRARQKELYPHASSDRYADWADQLKGKGGGPLFPEGYRAWVAKNQGSFSIFDDRAKILQHLHPTWASPKQAKERARQKAQDRIDKSNQELKDKWDREKDEREALRQANQDRINQEIADRKSQSKKSQSSSNRRQSTPGTGSMSIKTSSSSSSSSFDYKGQQDTKIAGITKTDAKVMMDIIKGGKGNVEGAVETLRNNMSPSNFEKLMLRLASGGGGDDTQIASNNVSYPTPKPGSGPYYGGEKQKQKDWLKKEMDRFDNFMQGPGGKFKVQKNRNNVMTASYQPEGSMIQETTFEKIKRLRKTWDYKDKPSPDGEPKNPPPEMVNGFHPEYGKHAARYKKLDPQSAKAMPPTGDPETDALVKKQAKKPK
jgi:hypothetical protein